jgi:hypothetical protein
MHRCEYVSAFTMPRCFITRQHFSGVSSTLVSEQAGWSSVTVVADYLHLAPQQPPMVSAGILYYRAITKPSIGQSSTFGVVKAEHGFAPALPPLVSMTFCPKFICYTKQQHSFSARNRIPSARSFKKPSLVCKV